MTRDARTRGRTAGARTGSRWMQALLVGMALAVSAPGVMGQARPDRPDRARLEERVRERMAQIIRERLALNQEEARALEEVVRETRERRRVLERREREVRSSLQAFEAEEPADDEDARGFLERMSELRMEEARLFSEEQEALLEILSPSQVLLLHQLRGQMMERLREFRSGGGRRSPGDGPGGGPLGRFERER